MSRTYEEQIEEMQKKIAALKKKQTDEKKRAALKIGMAVADRFPEILEMMQENGVNIFEYVGSEEFVRTVLSKSPRQGEKSGME